MQTMDYKCERCGYTSNMKCNLLSHLKKQKCCPSTFSQVDRRVLLQKIETKKTSLLCINCGMEFKNATAKCRHMKTCNTMISSLMSKINDLEKKIVEISQTVVSPQPQSCNVTSNTTNNNTNHNCNNTYNITLNNFCSENTEHLSSRLLVSCLVDMDLPRLLEQIHFDPDHPENHTVKLKNSNKKLLQYYEDGRWKIDHSSNVLDNMINCSGYRVLKAFYENNSDIVNQEAVDYVGENKADKLLKDIDKWLDKIEKEDEKTFKELKNRIFLVVLNGSAIVCERTNT